jgi:hypothetical protein
VTLTPANLTFNSVKFSGPENQNLVSVAAAYKVKTYSNSSGDMTIISNPPDIQSVSSNGRMIPSSTGTYLASLIAESSNQLQIWQNNGDNTFTDLSANIGSQPGGTPGYLAWSPDDTYLALCYTVNTNSHFLEIYERSGTTFTSIQSYSLGTASPGYITWSPNGTFIIISLTTSPYLAVYLNNNDGTFTSLPSAFPTLAGATFGHAWSNDEDYVVIGCNASPYAYMFSNNGNNTFSQVTFSVPFTTAVTNATWSPDGNYLMLSNVTNPLVIWENNRNGTFTELTSPTTPANGASSLDCFGWALDSSLIAIAFWETSSNVYIYKNNGDGTFSFVSNPPT